MTLEIDTARIFVADISRAKDFYSHVLGLIVANDVSDHGFVVYSGGTANLVVEVSALIDEISGEKLVGRFTALSFRVSDINAEYTRLVSTGTSFLSPPEKQSWGGWLAHFNDPDNNVLTLVQYAT